MTRELFWLALTVILTGLLWVPYIINRCQVRGLSGAMANPSRNDKPHADWARVAHLIVYTLGLPVFRTVAFTVGFLAQAVLALAIFQVV
jgi:MAPEG family